MITTATAAKYVSFHIPNVCMSLESIPGEKIQGFFWILW